MGKSLIIFQLGINKIANRIKFKVKAGYYLEPLTPETMNLLGNNKTKINKDEKCENVPHLETTLVYFNISTINY